MKPTSGRTYSPNGTAGSETNRKEPSLYETCWKRIVDVSFSFLAICIISPLLLVVAVLIRLKFGPPVLFRQQRPGLHTEPFTIIKFRTMNDARDAHGNLLPDAARINSFGHLLRSLSLDELPEFFNVILGDMSIVGPRPLLMQYLDRYTPEQARRHAVKPGITGWAQVKGRNAISWEKKFEFDLWYVNHVTLKLDLLIMAKTMGKIFKREDINQPGQATAEEFNPQNYTNESSNYKS